MRKKKDGDSGMVGVLNGICNRGMPTEINIHGWNKPGL